MKSKLLIAALFVGLVSQRCAVSQTDTNSVATSKPTISETTQTAQAAPPAATAETATVVATNKTDTIMASNMPAMNVPSAKASNTENAVEATTTNSPVAVMPIQFQDVPLTTAIENLARLAGINYLLDPKIGYGQPDQNGQIKPEPTISVRWENVSARQALLAVLDNYNLQLVEDPRTKIARITMKNPNAPPPLVTRVIQLKYASVSNMVIAIDSALTDKRSRVVADSRTSQLVVVATENEQDAVDTLVAQLDKPTRQVLIETRLMEISSSPSSTKGVDWSGTLQGQNITFGNGVLSGQTTINDPAPSSTSQTTTTYPGGRTDTTTSTTVGNPVSSVMNYILGNGGLSVDTARGFSPATAFLNADGVKAVLSFLNQDSDAQVIATPRIVTLDNQPAHIEVTRAVPVFATTAGTQGSPGGSQVTYTNLGTILDVTPRISANNYIWLTVAPEVSSVFDTVTKIVAGVENQADEYDIRKVNTQVLIPNANTLVMGGFIKDDTKNIYTKVPILGDIPVLGYAFRSESKSLDKDNLLIFITPTILNDTDFQPTTTKFLHSSAVSPESSFHPQGPWDSAKPHNWSNPQETDPFLNRIDQSLSQDKDTLSTSKSAGNASTSQSDNAGVMATSMPASHGTSSASQASESKPQSPAPGQ